MSKGPRYPRKGTYEGNPNPRSGRTCKCCGAVRAGRAHIQVSWFRADDEIVPCCKRCFETKTAQELLVAGRVPAGSLDGNTLRVKAEPPTTCPFCGARLQLGVEPVMLMHGQPTCPTFDRLDPLEFMKAANAKVLSTVEAPQ